MEHALKTRLVTAAVIAAVFAAGLLIGFAADNSFLVAAAEVGPVPAEAPPEDERPRGRRLYEHVNPTAEQQLLIDSIVAIHRQRTNAADEERRVAFQSAFREIVLETRAEIKTVLTEQQAREYQRLLDDWDARQAAERANGDSGNQR